MKLNADRVEGLTLTVILTTVALAAGWASFSHVHDWTMRHAPAGTPDAFGWVNAVISELVPVAALLTIKRRRRTDGPIGYPLFLLVAAGTLSLSAQLAVAQPSPSGWLLSAVPALAFMALVKLVFTSPATTPELVAAPVPATVPAPPPVPAVVPTVPVRPITRPNGVPVIGQVTR
ncbi:hypothetical protein Aph02nite_68690 [Actinoplanes philippinensis]|uniref:DUF2637 domain-containing protein n=1 Tax=Actinoplanes philippinensis TaxID=35752 RepID=A0A1I2KM42_9ACTN|nr:DUF2637 domain-containing protein [Actinoplanes philippinensis]GIE80919.1 hypothetical protein Aph02nite_68690 [Actinoplanes philippinensis]SFF68035.1 hypothetical protein SAMN05421541_117165 [Actinoplanes philippinensis]